mmetsp:Transcript_27491/g.60875  ORF Transcript_27491/g.60875 Transcript_27491/m.60875 type:complete len:254 (+) Transcript_27491:201-962(+)
MAPRQCGQRLLGMRPAQLSQIVCPQGTNTTATSSVRQMGHVFSPLFSSMISLACTSCLRSCCRSSSRRLVAFSRCRICRSRVCCSREAGMPARVRRAVTAPITSAGLMTSKSPTPAPTPAPAPAPAPAPTPTPASALPMLATLGTRCSPCAANVNAGAEEGVISRADLKLSTAVDRADTVAPVFRPRRRMPASLPSPTLSTLAYTMRLSAPTATATAPAPASDPGPGPFPGIAHVPSCFCIASGFPNSPPSSS